MGRCFEPEYVVRVVAALDLDEPVVLRSVGGSGAVVVTI
jgi:hypothetical protein